MSSKESKEIFCAEIVQEKRGKKITYAIVTYKNSVVEEDSQEVFSDLESVYLALSRKCLEKIKPDLVKEDKL